MNLDRINAGRSTTSSEQPVSVGTSSGSFVPAAPSRVGLIVGGPATYRFTLSLASSATLDEGITLYPTNGPLILSLEKHGDLVSRAWTAISATASQNVSVIEIFAGA